MNHQQYAKEHHRNHRLAKLDQGLCSLKWNCPEPVVTGKTGCKECLQALRDRVKAYRKKCKIRIDLGVKSDN